MLISRANMKGGRPLRGFPFDEDPKTGLLGYKVGYCSGCNEPIMIRSVELRDVVDHFGRIVDDRENKKVSLREWLVKKLGGRLD